jgi:hypothetical protein
MVINTDGFLSFVFDFCLSFIEKSISDNPEEKELLTELSNNFKLDMALPDYLNAAFVILSIIADQVKERKKDLVIALDQALCTHMAKLASANKLKLFLLIGSYADTLFCSIDEQQAAELKDQVLRELLLSLNYVNKKGHALALQAIETLNCFCESEPFKQRILANFSNVVFNLAQQVGQAKRQQFFEFLLNFCKVFKEQLGEQDLKVLMQALVQKILDDRVPPKKTLDLSKGKKPVAKNKADIQKKLATIRIAKCWSIVRFLAEEEKVAYYPCIEEMGEPLLHQIAEPIEDDDDILFFVSSLLKKKKATSPIFSAML